MDHDPLVKVARVMRSAVVWLARIEGDAMATIQDGEKWAAMQADWQTVNQEARTARFRVTHAFERCAAGDGSGPTTGQLDLAEKLEQAADAKRLAMDEFVTRVFG